MSVLDMSKRNQILVDLAIGRVVCRFLAERSYDVLSAQFGCSRPTLWRALTSRPQSLTPEEVDVIRKARAEWEIVRPLKTRFTPGGIAKARQVAHATVVRWQRKMYGLEAKQK